VDGVAYLVMEYVDGPTLHQELQGGAFPWLRATRIALQIASALGRAHQMGVVHRDLKPENILLVGAGIGARAGAWTEREADTVKLTDFGIAKIIDAPALTFSEQLFGTPGYIAPECVEGKPVDGRTDLYSLGVVLYEMLTGALPFEGRGVDLLTAPLTSAPIPPSARTIGVPPELESLVLQMLCKEKEERPADAFDVQEILGELSRREGGAADADPRESGDRDTVRPAEPARDASPTLVEATAAFGESGSSPAHRMTANVGRIQTREIALRWQGALTELEASIESARRGGGALASRAERAAALAEAAKAQLDGIERAARLAAEHQAKVDRLDARGREFRASLGHAIDELLRQRSRERIHGAALGARHDALKEGAPGADKGASDALMWETAALGAEAERARLQEEDLSFQIETLQARLDANNRGLEEELAEASGALEGSLAAVRQLTSEFVRSLDEAAAEMSASSSTPGW
jgi:serine/threonine-protein kinase